MDIQVSEFITEFIFSWLFDKKGQVCGGLAWGSKQIVVNLQSRLQLKNCYKKIIEDLCDWNTVFGEEAKFYDGCDDYTMSSPVVIQALKLTDSIVDNPLLGGSAANGKGCWKFAEWTNWAPYLA